MKKDSKIGFLGGDMRQSLCGAKLASRGLGIALFGFDKYMSDIGLCTRCDNLEDALEASDVIVLPMPSTTDGLFVNAPLTDKCIKVCEVIEKAKDCKLLLYGGNSSKIEQFAKEKGIVAFDCYKREDYKIFNAKPTSEGALAIAINEMPTTVYGSTCLVIGFGRIGKVLCHDLSSLGATVYASARKSEDIAWAKLSGYKAIKTSKIGDILPECDLILNTVPKTVLGKDMLEKIRRDTLIIDLASKPGGIDFKPAKEMGLNVVWALSLPGKTAPVTAGEMLADTIYKIMEEDGKC